MPDGYYQDARKKARRELRACIARGEYPYLPRLEELLPPEQLTHGIDLGVVQIPMEFVTGTKSGGRTEAFARNFLPLLGEETEFSQKWKHLCKVHLEEGIRDPVTAWEYMNRFYIEEGNKRVSVLKYFGAPLIPARVQRILPPRNDTRESQCYYAFVDFYRLSGINFIEFTHPEGYQQLQKAVGKHSGESWTVEEQRRFASVYYYFRQAYESGGGRHSGMTAGDALLVCLRVYPYHEIQGKDAADFRKLIDKLREEILLQQEDPSITVKLSPETQKSKPLLVKVLSKTIEKHRKAAFIHDKTPETSGWTYGHELGRRHVEEYFNGELETKAYFNAMSDNPAATLEQAIDDGNTVLFTTSPRLLPASLQIAVEHPEVLILNCSLNTSHRYIRTYYARMYEAKFISGAVAGTLAGGNAIGYICDYPIFGQVAGINAFALGVEMTNPRSRVYLEWSSVGGGIDAALKRLTDRGICLISSQDLASLGGRTNKSFGLSLICDGEQVNLVTPQWRWGVYYEELLRQIRNRSFQAEYTQSGKALNYYWGMSAGVVELVCSEKLPDQTRRLAELLRESICSCRCEPFRGPLYTQNGKLVEQSSDTFGPAQIMAMDWLNENIIGNIPVYGELDETAKATVDIVGIEPSTKKERGTA